MSETTREAGAAPLAATRDRVPGEPTTIAATTPAGAEFRFGSALSGSETLGGSLTPVSSAEVTGMEAFRSEASHSATSRSEISGSGELAVGLDRDEVIPIVEETAAVGKRMVETGRVRIRTYVEEVPESVSQTLAAETVEVRRVPIDRFIDAVPSVRTEDGVTIIPIFEEVLVVEKRVLLKEEVHLIHRVTHEEASTEVVLRKQRVAVQREALTPTPATGAMPVTGE